MIKSKRNKKYGFTLIELLTAVIIIAVLAAVAVPQYQKAVLKSRYSSMMPLAKALADSNETYYLANGAYAQDLEELPVQGKANDTSGTAVKLVDGQDLSYVQVSNTQVPNAQYVVYQKHSNKLSGATVCEAADERADKLCAALGGTETSPATGASWTAYLLSGTNSGVPGTCKVGTDTFQEGQAVGNNGLKCKAVCKEGDCEPQLTGGKVYDTDYSSYTYLCKATSGQEYKCAGSTFEGAMSVCQAGAENGCAASTFSGLHGFCYGYQVDGCAGSTFSGQNSACYASAAYGCGDSIFSGYKSNCNGDIANGCTGSIFSGSQSGCYGGITYGCAGATFSGDFARCIGEAPRGCADSSFQAGAFCYPTTSGGCNGVLYGAHPDKDSSLLGSCYDNDGHCPNGVPIRGSWNSTNGSYNIESWKGGYCDPKAMASGKCPAGTHSADSTGTLDGQCWDGSGNRVACE